MRFFSLGGSFPPLEFLALFFLGNAIKIELSLWNLISQAKKRHFINKEPPKRNYDPTNPGDVEENAHILLVLDVYQFFSVILIQSVFNINATVWTLVCNMVPAEAE